MENKELDRAFQNGVEVANEVFKDHSISELELTAKWLWCTQKQYRKATKEYEALQGSREAVFSMLENLGETIANRAEPWFLL